ncbi:MAG: WYL domain-containing protein, partial [Opitutales bacterium]|nr:WYL domain-containing protein [Opitutales bacterium]
EQMRDHLNAPIEYDRARRGYCYRGDLADMFELPGIWLTAEELQSLSALLALLNGMDSHLLKEELASVEKQIKKLLSARKLSVREFEQRIKFLPVANRALDSHIFTLVSEALLKRQRLSIDYCSYQQQKTRRDISPQTLIYYRENWYLDAWCHWRNDLRTFSIARIDKAEVLAEAAKKLVLNNNSVILPRVLVFFQVALNTVPGCDFSPQLPAKSLASNGIRNSRVSGGVMSMC